MDVHVRLVFVRKHFFDFLGFPWQDHILQAFGHGWKSRKFIEPDWLAFVYAGRRGLGRALNCLKLVMLLSTCCQFEAGRGSRSALVRTPCDPCVRTERSPGLLFIVVQCANAPHVDFCSFQGLVVSGGWVIARYGLEVTPRSCRLGVGRYCGLRSPVLLTVGLCELSAGSGQA